MSSQQKSKELLSDDFAQRLRSRMARLGIQANELAEKVGVTPGAVSNWLSGVNTVKGKHLRKVAEALACDPHWLLEGSGPEVPGTQLKEEFPASELDIWRRRAIAAESKLAQLRTGLRVLMSVGSDSPTPNSITREEAEEIVDQIEELADADIRSEGGSIPAKSSPPRASSHPTKKPNAP